MCAGRAGAEFDRRNNKILDVADVIGEDTAWSRSRSPTTSVWSAIRPTVSGSTGWGAKSAATVVMRYKHIDKIPLAAGQGDIPVRGGAKLAKTLADVLDEALLFRASPRWKPTPESTSVDELRWTGPADNLAEVADWLDAPDLVKRTAKLAEQRD